jgi:hypothetical protein
MRKLSDNQIIALQAFADDTRERVYAAPSTVASLIKRGYLRRPAPRWAAKMAPVITREGRDALANVQALFGPRFTVASRTQAGTPLGFFGVFPDMDTARRVARYVVTLGTGAVYAAVELPKGAVPKPLHKDHLAAALAN